MCIKVLTLVSGQTVPCRKCWQCTENVINDMVGRCIAESKTTRNCHAITLTYGRDADNLPDHERAALLTYSDVQKYFRSLRDAGFPARYFVVGEYGHKRGRAHWHVIIFWQKKVPKHQLKKRFMQEHWGWGVSHWKKVDPVTIRYNCKYLHKDDKTQVHKGMSTRPPLGFKYFENLANEIAKSGLAPHDLFYYFDDCRTESGKIIQFMMQGKTRANFIEHYIDRWAFHKPGLVMPHSDLIVDYLDKKCADEIEASPESFRKSNMTEKEENAWLENVKMARARQERVTEQLLRSKQLCSEESSDVPF